MISPSYFKNYPSPYYHGWQNEPIPGWGAKPVMAGPRMVAVGSLDVEEVNVFDPRIVRIEDGLFSADKSEKTGVMDVVSKPWFIAIAVIGVVSAIYLLKKD